jgi:succinate dehydrogenase / fumarate reductase cytochrome b subunit
MTQSASFSGSSVGQKIISALTGLFLCAFLVVHVSGNLLLFKPDGGRAFDAYASSNAASILIRSLEIVLFAGFLVHIIWGIRVWLFDKRARRQGYVENRPSANSSLPSRIMIWSGSIVLLFLVVHLKGFWVPMRFTGGRDISDFEIVKAAFQNPWYDLFYVACVAVVGYHLKQGFQSAFQTFGIRPLWRWPIDWVAAIFWLIIPIGFASMPVYFLLRRG